MVGTRTRIGVPIYVSKHSTRWTSETGPLRRNTWFFLNTNRYTWGVSQCSNISATVTLRMYHSVEWWCLPLDRASARMFLLPEKWLATGCSLHTMSTPEMTVGTRRVTESCPLCWCMLPSWHCLRRPPQQQHHLTGARSVSRSAIQPGALASWYGAWPKQSTTLRSQPSCPGEPPPLHGGAYYDCHHRTWGRGKVGPP